MQREAGEQRADADLNPSQLFLQKRQALTLTHAPPGCWDPGSFAEGVGAAGPKQLLRRAGRGRPLAPPQTGTAVEITTKWVLAPGRVFGPAWGSAQRDPRCHAGLLPAGLRSPSCRVLPARQFWDAAAAAR